MRRAADCQHSAVGEPAEDIVTVGHSHTVAVNGCDETVVIIKSALTQVYDILQSMEDKPTVPICYEARLAKIDLKPEERPKIDPNIEEGAGRRCIAA